MRSMKSETIRPNTPADVRVFPSEDCDDSNAEMLNDYVTKKSTALVDATQIARYDSDGMPD